MRKLTTRQKFLIGACVAVGVALILAAGLFVLYVIVVTRISLV